MDERLSNLDAKLRASVRTDIKKRQVEHRPQNKQHLV